METQTIAHRTSRQIISLDGKDWIIIGNIRRGPGEFDADVHCDICDPGKKQFHPKLIEIGGKKICGHCVMVMTQALNEATLYDCREGKRY